MIRVLIQEYMNEFTIYTPKNKTKQNKKKKSTKLEINENWGQNKEWLLKQ